MSTEQNSAIQPDFEKEGGLLPAIAQDEITGEVLMLAWMNKEAWETTLSTGQAVYYSRSRKRLWPKGESSGHVQLVKSIRLDCDKDVILLGIEQIGRAACHTGRRTCFHKRVHNDQLIDEGEILFNPDEVYHSK
ncbi:MAG: phosphoribosyl-AMP cyclohydrolase [Spirochaetales bacterium]|nr:phosphoribosyl-AMP cyclohydrolase [Spirochaetales bacterium]